MTESLIFICGLIAALVAWTFKVMLRIERRMTRLETLLRIRKMRSHDTEQIEKEKERR
jgi:hypothetical protein